MQKEPIASLKFIRSVLPWILAVAALVAYLFTVNTWVSLYNLNFVARIYGWTSTPVLNGPIYYVVTLPLHFLPVKWIPLGLNLFSVLCATLALGQLARSVALLPHDRTLEQRLRENSEHSTLSIPLAWLPPILAVLACGLQLSFWEHATNGTGEMFDLLLFSYVVRSLLEYRIDRRESRLMLTAFVYGLGMTNNFAMIGFLPVFIGAIAWIRGLSFFNFRFLSRMAFCGLAGLAFYLVLPLLAMFHSIEPVGFWEAFRINLASQISAVFQSQSMLGLSTRTIGTLALTSLLPALIISIRWASYFGDSSRIGNALATLMFHIVHVGFLLACLWIFFDPPFSPRQKSVTIPFLTFYYLGALSVGYFSGYLLLVFRPKNSHERGLSLLNTVNRMMTGLIFVLLALIPACLIYRNLPQIRITNGPTIKQFAASIVKGLPRNGILLSDEPRGLTHRLLLAESLLALEGRDKDYLFLETAALDRMAYLRHLNKEHPEQWELPQHETRARAARPLFLVNQLLKLAKGTNIYYLHPSFGYFFEAFYPLPHGLVFELQPYEAGILLPPKLSPEIVAENEAFWATEAEQTLKSILNAGNLHSPEEEEKPPLIDRLFEKLHISREKNAQNSALSGYYSRSLNYWGVEMQRQGELSKAASRFKLALQVNPDNVVANVNLAYNKNLRAGIAAPIAITKAIEENLGKYKTWDEAVIANGPYDEPALCYGQASLYIYSGYYRQAAQNLTRAARFLPNDVNSRIALGQVNNLVYLPDQALAVVEEIRSHPEKFILTSTNQTDLTVMEASAWFEKREADKARSILEKAAETNPNDDRLLSNMHRTYMHFGDYTNALGVVERRLKLNPGNISIMVDKASIQIMLQEFDAAIALLNRVLVIDPKNDTALFNRAIARLHAGGLDDAKLDYKQLEKTHADSYQVYYGLAEIAWRQKDANTAIRYYEAYLTNAPPNAAEVKLVNEHLKQLKGEKPK